MRSWGYLLIFRNDAAKGEVAPKIRNGRAANTATIKAYQRRLYGETQAQEMIERDAAETAH